MKILSKISGADRGRNDVALGPKCGAKVGPDWKRFIFHT